MTGSASDLLGSRSGDVNLLSGDRGALSSSRPGVPLTGCEADLPYRAALRPGSDLERERFFRVLLRAGRRARDHAVPGVFLLRSSPSASHLLGARGYGAPPWRIGRQEWDFSRYGYARLWFCQTPV